MYGKGPSEIGKGKLHGSVDIGLSVISSKMKRRRIDIDAEEFIYHLKAKTEETFASWVQQLTEHRLYRQHVLSYGKGGYSNSASDERSWYIRHLFTDLVFNEVLEPTNRTASKISCVNFIINIRFGGSSKYKRGDCIRHSVHRDAHHAGNSQPRRKFDQRPQTHRKHSPIELVTRFRFVPGTDTTRSRSDRVESPRTEEVLGEYRVPLSVHPY